MSSVFPFLDLPTELQAVIISTLPAREVCNVSCVCSTLREIADSDEVWQPVCLREELAGKNLAPDEGESYKDLFRRIGGKIRYDDCWAFVPVGVHLVVINCSNRDGVRLVFSPRTAEFDLNTTAGTFVFNPVTVSCVRVGRTAITTDHQWKVTNMNDPVLDMEFVNFRYGIWSFTKDKSDTVDITCAAEGVSKNFSLVLTSGSNGWIEIKSEDAAKSSTIWSADGMTSYIDNADTTGADTDEVD